MPVSYAPLKEGPSYGFEQALIWIKQGRKLRRQAWKGKFVYYVPEHKITTGIEEIAKPLIETKGEGIEVTLMANIYMQLNDGNYTGWTPTIKDILANDWSILV